ncbi:MAG: glycosyltransferase family 4 protein [Bacillota bacterium]
MTQTKKRIAFISPNMAKAGMQRQLAVLLNNLNKDKFEVFLVLFDDLIEYEFQDHVKVIVVKKRRGIFDFKFIFGLIYAIFKIKPHIIQSCIARTNRFAMALGFIFRFRNIILSVRCSNEYEEYKVMRLLSRVFKYRYIIANSNKAKEELIQYVGAKPNSIKVIYNGIDVERFKPDHQIDKDILNWRKQNCEVLKQKHFIILVAARVAEQKNHLSIISALNYLKSIKKLPEDLVFICIGSIAEDSYYKKCSDLILDYGLSNYVLFEDAVDRIEKYYNISNTICLPSYCEGFPNVALEGMACEKPIIISTGGNSDDLIENGLNGWIFETDNIELFAKTILEAYESDEDSLRKIGVENRKKVVNNFSIDKMIYETQNIYENLLNQYC